MAAIGPSHDVSATDLDGLVALARDERFDLVVVGPEAPLVEGLVDRLVEIGVSAFGPTKTAAQLEGSKSFAKEICDAAGVPSAGYRRFDAPEPALIHLETIEPPYVVKADGLAAGKGVIVAERLEDARRAVVSMFEGVYGEAGASVVIEDFLEGEEASLFVLVDGETVLPLAGARDFKRAYDGDRGPNTGGMGAISPAPALTPEIWTQAVDRIVAPTVREMARRGAPFRGLLYAGLMIDENGPRLIEYNVRFGDPEAQCVLPLIEGDFAAALRACADGTLKADALRMSDRAAATVVLAAEGYPVAYEKGSVIQGVDGAAAMDDVLVFHAGTSSVDDTLIAAGGRVLGVTGLDATAEGAVARAYGAADAIDWPGGFYRKDIGAR